MDRPPTPTAPRTTRPRPTTDSAAARVPPQDLDAEKALLGCMLIDRDVVGLVVQIIPADEAHRFYVPDHQQLYRLLVDIYDANRAMDIVVVRNELERRSLLAPLGGVDYLTELVESVPSATHAEHYAIIVRDKSLLRDVIACTGRIQEEAYEHRNDAAELLDRAEKALFEVTERRIRNQAVALKDILQATFEQLEASDGYTITGLPSGFIELDDLTSGFQRGELIIVAARPSMGKTALGLTLAEHAAVDEDRPTAFFSMEMGRQQIAQRVLCSRGRVDAHKLRKGMMSDTEIGRLQGVASEMEAKPLFVDDTPGMSVMELRAKARRLKMLHDVQAVFIDYLQLMRDPVTARESRQHEIATISRGLKALARELNIPVIALAQLNRNPEGREGNRPRMSDLRESGAIEQDADVIILLHREEYYKPNDPEVKNKAELIVAKQRNGPVGTVNLHFDLRFTRFDNLHGGPDPGYVPYDEPAAESPAEEAAPF